jgi:Fic family protein
MKIGALRISPELLRLIAEIDEFKGGWRAMAMLAPERLAVLKRVATIESIGSSTRIEGAKLTDAQVEELLGRLETKAFVSRDEQEVAGYAEVMDAVFDSHASIPLTENYIKQLHAMLLRHSTKDERHRGEYKKLPNNVEALLVFFLRSLKKQKDRLTEKVARDPGAEGLHPDALKILEEARRTGRITTGDAEKLTGAKRPTVKARLGELVKRGLLVRQGQGRGAWYGLPPAQ